MAGTPGDMLATARILFGGRKSSSAAGTAEARHFYLLLLAAAERGDPKNPRLQTPIVVFHHPASVI